jgi:hypothetical protein
MFITTPNNVLSYHNFGFHGYILYTSLYEPGSSVSTVSGYRLDDWVIEAQSPAKARGFFL